MAIISLAHSKDSIDEDPLYIKFLNICNKNKTISSTSFKLSLLLLKIILLCKKDKFFKSSNLYLSKVCVL